MGVMGVAIRCQGGSVRTSTIRSHDSHATGERSAAQRATVTADRCKNGEGYSALLYSRDSFDSSNSLNKLS